MSLALLSRRRGGAAGGGGGDTLTASLTRYDGNSGTARFRGAIPCRPGVITSEEDIAGIRLLERGSEPVGGVYFQPLEGRHAEDDSYQEIYVEFDAECGADETVPCTVLFNSARTVPDLTEPEDAVELSPLAWHAAPTLFAVTNPTHLCASRIAPFALVPLNHPNMPSSVRTFLTTTLDEWNEDSVARDQDAQYDENAGPICRYLTTGEPRFLADALMRNVSEDTTGVVTAQKASYYRAAAGARTGGIDLNPSEYASNGDSGLPSEPYTASVTMFMVYRLTGSAYARIHLEKEAAFLFADGYYANPEWQPWAYAREGNRTPGMLSGVLAAIIGMSRGISVTAEPRTFTPGIASIASRLATRFTYIKNLAAAITPGSGGVSAWWTKIWGVPAASVATQPNFQFDKGHHTYWFAFHNGIVSDSAIPLELDNASAWIRSQTEATPTIASNGYPVYGQPYVASDPAALPTEYNGFFTTCAAWLGWAWHYARSGDTTSRDFALHIMDARHMYYNASDGRMETQYRKSFGEWALGAFIASAWLCGVPWNGWEVEE